MHESSYQGIPIGAAGNAHQHVVRRLEELVPPPASVLDIAAGHGALTARLIAAGYSVTANDLDASRFVPGLPCSTADLNGAFADELGGPYEAILAVEIIEHLESPAAFLRSCATLLAPDGVLIVSTPNLDAAVSRLRFLTTGRPSWFSEQALALDGHISPQLPWVLEAHARGAGLEPTEQWCSDPAIVGVARTGWKSRLLYHPSVLRQIERRWGARGGDVRFFVLRRAAPAG